MKKYPNDFNEETYTTDNIKWIWIHIVSRTFGNFLNYITFVPIAEMFNHENTDLYFDVESSKKKEEKDNKEDNKEDK